MDHIAVKNTSLLNLSWNLPKSEATSSVSETSSWRSCCEAIFRWVSSAGIQRPSDWIFFVFTTFEMDTCVGSQWVDTMVHRNHILTDFLTWTRKAISMPIVDYNYPHHRKCHATIFYIVWNMMHTLHRAKNGKLKKSWQSFSHLLNYSLGKLNFVMNMLSGELSERDMQIKPMECFSANFSSYCCTTHYCNN